MTRLPTTLPALRNTALLTAARRTAALQSRALQSRTLQTAATAFRAPAFQAPAPAFRSRSCVGGSDWTKQDRFSFKDVKVKRLKNGATLVVAPSVGKVAVVGVWLKFGSRAEREDEHGVVHFLEHMTFKGSQKRSRKELDRFIEDLGAQLNAYTTKEYVAYCASCLPRDAPKVLEAILDLLTQPKLAPEAILDERRVILRESCEVNLIDEEVLFDALHTRVYPNSSLGKCILGTADRIQSIDSKQLSSFVNEMYRPEYMVAICVGASDESSIEKLCESLSPGGREVSERRQEKAPEFRSGNSLDVSLTGDALRTEPLLYAARITKGIPWEDSEGFMLSLLTRLMLQGREQPQTETIASSRVRVPTTLSPAKGNGQPVFFDAHYKGCGITGAYSRFEILPQWRDRLLSATDSQDPYSQALVDEICSYVDRKIVQAVKASIDAWTEQDLQASKTNIKIMFGATYDSSLPMAEELARQILISGEVRDLPVPAGLDSITLEDLKAFALRMHVQTKDVARVCLLRLPTKGAEVLASSYLDSPCRYP